MTVKQKIGLGVGIAITIIGGIIAGVFYATSGLPRASDSFLSLVKQGKIAEAYQSTATEFRAGTSEAEFRNFLETTSLAEYQSASWSSRSIQNDRGTLEGTVTTKSGGKIPLRMEFVKEGGSWKIYSMHKPRGGLVDEAAEAKPALPSEAEAEGLARQTLGSFAQAIKTKDFAAFYESLSPVWKKQTDVAGLQSHFQSFMTANPDLLGVVSAPVEWAGPPSLNENQLLVLRGRMLEIPEKPLSLAFELTYHFGEGLWKLMGIEVTIR